jgi:hypothetical protein
MKDAQRLYFVELISVNSETFLRHQDINEPPIFLSCYIAYKWLKENKEAATLFSLDTFSVCNIDAMSHDNDICDISISLYKLLYIRMHSNIKLNGV